MNLHPFVTYRFSSSTGLQSAPGQSSDSAIQAITPGVSMELGDRWTLDYTPTLQFYSSSAFRNSTDHSVRFGGGTAYRNWTFGLSQSYSRSSQLLIETASQTDQESFSTGINAGCRLTEALSLSLGISQSFQFVGAGGATGPLNNSRSWSSMDWLDYGLTERLSLAIGIGGGYEEPSISSSMAYEQLQGRINWRLGDKFTVGFNGGIENRQFLGSGTPDALNPIFGINLQSPFEITRTTTFSLQANRTMSSSALQNTLNVSTVFGGSLSQRLLQRLFLTLNAGYSLTSYESTAPGLQATREDNSISFGARLSTAFLKRATAAVFYQGTKNSSGQAGFGYSSRQYGVELGYRF